MNSLISRTEHSVCPLDCADTCSLSIELEGDRVVKVRGSDANPFTRGKICAKVADGLPQQVHGEGRLSRPLRLTGAKGPGARFEEISWDEALDTIAQRFHSIIEDMGAEAIVPLSYGGPMGLLAGGSIDQRFFNSLGSTQVNAAPLCAGTASAAYASLFGDAGGIRHEELGESKLIVVWGNNITACNLHLTKIIRDAKKQGAQLVVVDPKRIRIAENADLHLDLLPGTDVVLAYAVAAELERIGGLDQAFIEQHVLGAEAFLEKARGFTIEQAAAICGLAADDIKTFAQMWASLSPAAITVGIGPERNRNGGSGIRAALSLPCLTGNIGKTGGGVCDTGEFFPFDRDRLSRPDLIPEGTREISILDVPRLILEPESSETPVKALFIYNHNPVAVHPRQKMMQKALAREDLFIVGSDISMTDSMFYADIILPACTHLESNDVYGAYGHSYVQRAKPVIPPVGNALPNTEIFRRLATRFSFANESGLQDSDETLIEQLIDTSHAAMNGRTAQTLVSGDAVDCSRDGHGNETPGLLRGQNPDTPSGKIELYSQSTEAEGGSALPSWQPLYKQGDFILVSPSSEKRINSTFGNLPGHDSDVVLEINPLDAERCNITQNQKVKVFNEQASIVLSASLSDTIKPGTVYCAKGAWLNGQDATLNALIPGHTSDLAQGACYNDTQVNLKGLTDQ